MNLAQNMSNNNNYNNWEIRETGLADCYECKTPRLSVKTDLNQTCNYCAKCDKIWSIEDRAFFDDKRTILKVLWLKVKLDDK